MTTREQLLLELGKLDYQMFRYLMVERLHMQNKAVIDCANKIKDAQRNLKEFDDKAEKEVDALKKEMGM